MCEKFSASARYKKTTLTSALEVRLEIPIIAIRIAGKNGIPKSTSYEQ